MLSFVHCVVLMVIRFQFSFVLVLSLELRVADIKGMKLISIRSLLQLPDVTTDINFGLSRVAILLIFLTRIAMGYLFKCLK